MDIFRFAFESMGSGCEILVAGSDKNHALKAVEATIQEINRIERKYSRYLPQSIVSSINEGAGQGSVECDDETMFLLRYAGTLFEQSNGLFDVTSGVLGKAWDFDRKQLPEKQLIDELLELVGWKKVECDGNRVQLSRKGMRIDLGGIGKEYAADRAAGMLYECGIRHGYVNMAGDIRIVGPMAGGEPWMIGIRDPRKSDGLIATIPLYTGAIATSGDSERYFEVAGRRYSHIINPVSGCPVNYWRSVTVVAPSAMSAGSCSTITMLREAGGLDYLDRSGFQYLAVDQTGKLSHKS
jgi:thiamine biosynthesis lipoprotein